MNFTGKDNTLLWLTATSDLVYFHICDSVNKKYNLWRTDGMTNGAIKLKTDAFPIDT